MACEPRERLVCEAWSDERAGRVLDDADALRSLDRLLGSGAAAELSSEPPVASAHAAPPAAGHAPDFALFLGPSSTWVQN